MHIDYKIETEDNNVFRYSIDTFKGIENPETDIKMYPWIKLSYHKCEICPLSEKDNAICPAASDIVTLTLDFKNLKSFDRVKVTVNDQERSYFKNCDVQTALNSLLGLVLSTGNCPVLGQLRYMAHTHLPFANFEESIIRTMGHYLIKQIINQKDGKEHDLNMEMLGYFYSYLKIVNSNLQKRLQKHFHTDANINAVQAFFSLSSLIEYSLNDELNDIKHLFV